VSDGNNRGRDGHGRAPFVGPHALPAARTIQPVYYADNVISTVSRTPFRAASSCIHHQQAFEASAWPHKRTVAYARGFPKADRPQSTNDGRRKPHPRPLNERQLTAVARPKADRPLPTTVGHPNTQLCRLNERPLSRGARPIAVRPLSTIAVEPNVLPPPYPTTV
jgi:hypothetical protein